MTLSCRVLTAALLLPAGCPTPQDLCAVYEHAMSGMNAFDLAYLQLTEPRWSGRDDGDVTKDKGFSQPLSNHKYVWRVFA
eukprot:COSAG05_NODE_4614_length_1438_cov_1.262136_1_plen_80_part_00